MRTGKGGNPHLLSELHHLCGCALTKHEMCPSAGKVETIFKSVTPQNKPGWKLGV